MSETQKQQGNTGERYTRTTSTLDKYIRRRTRPPKSENQTEIRITSKTRPPTYIAYAAQLILEKKEDVVTIKASGIAIKTACIVADVLRRRIKNLAQIISITNTTITDEYLPQEEGLDTVKVERTLAVIEIKLSRNLDALDKDDVGYMAALAENEVEEREFEELIKIGSSRRGGVRGNRRGRGVSRPETGRRGLRIRGGRPFGARSDRDARNDRDTRNDRDNRRGNQYSEDSRRDDSNEQNTRIKYRGRGSAFRGAQRSNRNEEQNEESGESRERTRARNRGLRIRGGRAAGTKFEGGSQRGGFTIRRTNRRGLGGPRNIGGRSDKQVENNQSRRGEFTNNNRRQEYQEDNRQQDRTQGGRFQVRGQRGRGFRGTRGGVQHNDRKQRFEPKEDRPQRQHFQQDSEENEDHRDHREQQDQRSFRQDEEHRDYREDKEQRGYREENDNRGQREDNRDYNRNYRENQNSRDTSGFRIRGLRRGGRLPRRV